jgi:hypothetical protein
MHADGLFKAREHAHMHTMIAWTEEEEELKKAENSK